MLTVDFIDLLNGWAALAKFDPADIPAVEFGNARGLVSRRLETAWDFEKWPEIRRLEKRYFRAIYGSGTAYAAGDEVYYPAAGDYFQALRATTGNAPADASGNVTAAYWARCATDRSADNYSASKAYTPGSQVYYPTTDLFYQCHTASTGNAPTDATHWAVIFDFSRYVAFNQAGQTALGTILRVTDRNPRTRGDAAELDWSLSELGAQVRDAAPSCWVDFKLVCPTLKGAVFNAASIYTAGSQVYFSSATLPGNFYDCLATTAAGESPATAPTKWSVVQIPKRLDRYLIQGAYADWLPADGQNEKKGAEAGEAERLLAAQQILLNQQQGRGEGFAVSVR